MQLERDVHPVEEVSVLSRTHHDLKGQLNEADGVQLEGAHYQQKEAVVVNLDRLKVQVDRVLVDEIVHLPRAHLQQLVEEQVHLKLMLLQLLGVSIYQMGLRHHHDLTSSQN
jgi:hypothetical protein